MDIIQKQFNGLLKKEDLEKIFIPMQEIDHKFEQLRKSLEALAKKLDKIIEQFCLPLT